jgi:hypothetical protein
LKKTWGNYVAYSKLADNSWEAEGLNASPNPNTSHIKAYAEHAKLVPTT